VAGKLHREAQWRPRQTSSKVTSRTLHYRSFHPVAELSSGALVAVSQQNMGLALAAIAIAFPSQKAQRGSRPSMAGGLQEREN
jgi:hypothetical protein